METLTRTQRLMNVKKLEDSLNTCKGDDKKTKIPVRRFVRIRRIEDDVVDAYVTPVANGIETPTGRRQVNKGNWIVIHSDGRQASYTPEEFVNLYQEGTTQGVTPGGTGGKINDSGSTHKS